jgi:beta-N-acetylhexosaminidase
MYRVESLTDEQLAGQRLVVGFEGKTPQDALAFLLQELPVGGLILFKRNVSDPDQLRVLCEGAQALALEAGIPPLVISIDQEGGPVARLGPPFSVFPGNRAIGKDQSDMEAREFGARTARELKNVGIHLNFAPVLDIVPEALDDGVMADRVFGSDPDLVARLGNAVIESLQKHGVAATAKHFPGIGRTTLDSHIDLPFLDTHQKTLASTDLVPFQAAIDSGVEAVMLSHIVYNDLDPTWPAGLSRIIGKDLLRGEMGFQGVTITDDLDMGAIDKHYDVGTFVERICQAEMDIALICHDRQKMATTHNALLAALRKSEDQRARFVASVKRILRLKERYVATT